MPVSGQYTHTHVPLVQLGVDDVLRLVGTGASREGEEVGHVLVRHAADQLVGCSEGLSSASGTNTQHLCVWQRVCGGGEEQHKEVHLQRNQFIVVTCETYRPCCYTHKVAALYR